MQKFSSRLACALKVVNGPLENKGLSNFHFVLKNFAPPKDCSWKLFECAVTYCKSLNKHLGRFFQYL